MTKETPRDPEKFGRTLEIEALKALAHPLRVQLFDALSTYGPATASGLAERLGESSGATSYHLRQLAKHDLVREVEGRGSGRERWWERVPGGIAIEAASESEAARHASKIVLGEWNTAREKQLTDFLTHGPDELSTEWMEASTVNTSNLAATVEEVAEFMERIIGLINEFVDPRRDRSRPGTRPVQLQFSIFPVIGGDEIPTNDTPTTN
ncbi:MAG TPA: helix-turn-helix domain-containing protein [Terrimesophilobacter sp.]|nr:helix-turn-helix domain-containing protein [Terrimesophilobacter sp.]HRP98893.1 helix-turn-helix domain-containing protein [Terrimesophilobacter sp.]